MRIIRTNYYWAILDADPQVNYCLERLALSKSYSVAGICQELGCSQRHLYTTFMRDIGFPPKHWLMMERMVVAKRKLEGGKSPKQVAQDLGFVSATTFSRQFFRYYEILPERFVKTRKVFNPAEMKLVD
ncbi:MAG: helix-turn-helix domain-containing protein [Luteolibacter sp.]